MRTDFYKLTVAAVDRLTDDAAAVTFEVPDELHETFTFDAGQSLTIRRIIDGVEERRQYSICAQVGTAPRIGVREIPGGLFSKWLVHDVRPGDVLEVQAPSGNLRADPAPGARHLCIAAGSGITPLLSIASTVLTNPESTVTLLYGNRTTSTVMFAEELADLKNAHGPRFHLIHVLSREPRDVELFNGRLDADRLRTIITMLVPLDEVDHIWLCGPFEMLNEARHLLGQLGAAAAKVHFELFFVDEPPQPLVREDPAAEGATSEVTFVLDGRSTMARMQRDRTILDSAQGQRGDMPFACKGGVCGTCRARVVDGEVNMVRNYALEPAEVDAGFVLTCQTYPVGDATTVDYDA